ncbi:hypothetical protein H1P_70004 [Hyella patelloides LEGE 07179]|uniref:Uncharacterized protein n=1 Tax=Hyella patelloides LEGE 07179 TaxID=945734 RepID=A0A563W357_9CYAN|nr:hypothetical protein H1P_70004 [Hyella patelloides LEGE 07179]
MVIFDKLVNWALMKHRYEINNKYSCKIDYTLEIGNRQQATGNRQQARENSECVNNYAQILSTVLC